MRLLVRLLHFSVKPFVLDELLVRLCDTTDLRQKNLITIVAGHDLQHYKYLGYERVIRVMPNTPCQIRKGMTAVCAAEAASDFQQLAVDLFRPLGRCIVLPERQFNVFTALAGSGPAFAW